MKATLFPGHTDQVVLDDQMLRDYIDNLHSFLHTYLYHLLTYHNEVDSHMYPEEFGIFHALSREQFDDILLHHRYESDCAFLKAFYALVLPRRELEILECASKTLAFQSNVAKQKYVLCIVYFLRQAGLLGKQFAFVEIGAGKGYLSMHLASLGENVVSVEGSIKHAFSWSKRLHGLLKLDKSFSANRVRFCSAFVSGESSVQQMLSSSWDLVSLDTRLAELNPQSVMVHKPNSPIYGMTAPEIRGERSKCNAVVIGLHACGSLSSTILALKPQTAAAITVPCCFSHIYAHDFLMAPQMLAIKSLILEICAYYTRYHSAQPRGSTIAQIPNHLLTQDGYIAYETYYQQICSFRHYNNSENVRAFEIYCTVRYMLGYVMEGAVLVDRLLRYGAKIDFGLHGLSGKGFIYGIYE